jgi:uncharacterized membrane protein YdjX (TVP38/TMEM64 family)
MSVEQIGSHTTMAQNDDTPKSAGMSFKRILPALIIATVAILAFVFLRDFLSFDVLAENRQKLIDWRDSNYLLTVLAFMGLYIAFVAFSIPGSLFMTLAGGFLFGLFPGVFYIVIAATIGAAAIFLAAKMGFGDALQAKLDGSTGVVRKCRDGIKENELSYLFLMRLVPAVPFFAANLVPALVGVSLRRFLFTTFFGIIPGTLVYTWVGSGLGEVFASGEKPSLGIIWEWQILGPILGLSVLAALPIVLKFFRRSNV